MEGIIRTIPDRCKRCYGCIRECPAKAIQVVNGQALVMQERCIVCGHCVKVCSLHAKQVQSVSYDNFLQLINENSVIAIIAPSFAASWPGGIPENSNGIEEIRIQPCYGGLLLARTSLVRCTYRILTRVK